MDESKRAKKLPVLPPQPPESAEASSLDASTGRHRHSGGPRPGGPEGAADPRAEVTTSAEAAPGAGPLTRRDALKILAAATAAPVLATEACQPSAPADAPGASAPSNPLARGTPSDPDLVAPVVPWDGVLTDDEMLTVRALCDLILPADDRSPSASAVGVPEFIDEWIGAPYPSHQREQVMIRGGLVWLDTEAGERFGQRFAALTVDQQREICDRIRYVPEAAPEDRAAALFFDRFRDLTATGFWTTDEGMADLGFVGNVPLASWDGPPQEVLERLGLA